MGGPTADEASSDRVTEVTLRFIREASEWTGRLTTRQFMRPPPTSRASRDHLEVSHDEVRTARLQHGLALTGMRLHSARSCLDAIVAASSLPDTDTPIHVLARAVLESSAWARWLCDPKLTTNERISRVAADELHGAAEKKRILDEIGQSFNGEADLRAQLQAAGISPAKRPRSTEVVGMLLDMEDRSALRITYRKLSARPHSSSHMLFDPRAVFAGSERPARQVTFMFLWCMFDFATYVEWVHLPEWVAWAETMKSALIE